MAYEHTNSKGTKYYLNTKEVELRGGKRRIYYFSKQATENSTNEVPEGFKVVESERTGLPVLKKENAEKK